GNPGHRVQPESAAGGERVVDDRVGGVEVEQRRREVDAVGQGRGERVRHERLAAQLAVRVAGGDPDLADLLLADGGQGAGGGVALLVVPQGVRGDEALASD